MNTLGTPTNRFPLYDPRGVRAERMRFRRDSIPALAHANSMYMTCGKRPSRGWILLARADYDRLDRYATDLQLEVGDPNQPNNVGVLKNLAIVQAQCVTRGLASDDDALYLVELTDARGILHNDWFSIPITAQYNIRSQAYPQTFQLDSMKDYPAGNGKTTWTWATMLQDMWERMPLLGAWPGFPQGVSPNWTPEGFWFPGVPAWPALCDVLAYLGLTVACDLTSSTPFTIVSDGATDSAFTALQLKYKTNLEDDLEWIDTGAGRVPGFVKVLFRRRNSIYGTEETVAYRNDAMAQQWDTKAYYSVTISAPAHFTGAVGTHYLWSDFTVRYGDGSDPLDADIAIANQIAAERVVQYFDNIYSRTAGSLNQTYAGALPFTTGSQVDGVAWVHDMKNDEWFGWRTKLVRGPRPPWPEIWNDR